MANFRNEGSSSDDEQNLMHDVDKDADLEQEARLQRKQRGRSRTRKESSSRRTRNKNQSDTAAGVVVPPSRPVLGRDEARLPDDTFYKTKLRACMICSLIKGQADFEKDGCDNCEKVLKLAGQQGSVFAYTSEVFDGMIGLVDPSNSWVAKWQHIQSLKKGLYAVSVSGKLPGYLRRELAEVEYRYRNRDRTSKPNVVPLKSGSYSGAAPPSLRTTRKKKKKQQQQFTQNTSPSEFGGVVSQQSVEEDDSHSCAMSTFTIASEFAGGSEKRFEGWRSTRIDSDDEDVTSTNGQDRMHRILNDSFGESELLDI